MGSKLLYILFTILPFISQGQTAILPIPVQSQSVTVTLMTFDAINHGTNTIISGSNLTATNSSITGSVAIGTIFHSSGKYYCEFTSTWTGAGPIIGIMKSGYVTADLNGAFLGSTGTTNGYGCYMQGAGSSYNSGVLITAPITANAGQTSPETYCMALDLDNDKCYIGYVGGGVTLWYNGSGASSTFSSAINVFGTFSGSFTAAVGFHFDIYILNAGQSTYAGIKPAGYTNW